LPISSRSKPWPISLKEQVAGVRGGGRGIGGAIALPLADAGARVAVIARSAGELGETVRLIEQKSGTAKAFPADVTEAAALALFFVEIERSLGPLDVLVNNAGILGPWDLLCRRTRSSGGARSK
jgi:NAD(P)-dependent dehydrogenase (short-subunit alcohol dehydrogenase family)